VLTQFIVEHWIAIVLFLISMEDFMIVFSKKISLSQVFCLISVLLQSYLSLNGMEKQKQYINPQVNIFSSSPCNNVNNNNFYTVESPYKPGAPANSK
jgi:hypothetical protein